ncbi:MAG: hemolysin family protein [Bryobacteraceae bacterium]|nr:hemolysin family protein [Bryobacteraceae bacterium]
MGGIGIEITLVLLLVIANGVFAMAELAVVSARKARLQQRADDGSRGAAVALELARTPDDFLSTVQVGITLIGTLAGAFGGATIAEKLAVSLRTYEPIAAYADSVAITIVVVMITYLSLILGELVPKNLALARAEGIASALAPPMRALSRAGAPAVRFLTFSTKVVMKLIPLKASTEAPVTEEEIKALLAQGAAHGAFEEAEQELVEGVFRLGDRRVVDLMRPRGKVCWLDLSDDWDTNREVIASSPYSRFPVIQGDLDHVIGVLHVRDLFLTVNDGRPVDLRALARSPLVLPERTAALEALRRFQETGEQMALIVDEHGGIEGIVTLTDIMEAVLGELTTEGDVAGSPVVRREDGSWLVEGTLPISDLLEELKLRKTPGDETGFSTVAGLVLAHLQRIPTVGEAVEVEGWRFEVVDMDGHRVDKVLVSKVGTE